MGRWSTEATQGVDYFQYIGDIEWKPQVKDYFLKTLNLWHLMGKYHLPHAELAVLNSDRNQRLTGFPWNIFQQPDVIFSRQSLVVSDQPIVAALIPAPESLKTTLRAAMWTNTASSSMPTRRSWIPIPSTRSRSGCAKAAPSSLISKPGGIPPSQPDAWPISKLTGYNVTGIDKLSRYGDGMPGRQLHPVKGQTVFDPSSTSANTLNTAPDFP